MISAVTGAVGLVVALLIILLIRTDRLSVVHGLGWLVAAMVMGGLGFAPSVFDSIATKLGISYAPSLAFTIGLSAVLLKLFIDDIERSRLKMRQTRVIQRIAILENELRREKKRYSEK